MLDLPAELYTPIQTQPPTPKPLPRLTTKQTQKTLDEYPPLEYLESDYVADWLQVRFRQLLELAKEERRGSNLSKTVSLVVGAAGFIFHAASPLAPIGAIAGAASWLWATFLDLDQTHQFSPVPFVRGSLFDVIGTLGHAGLREEASKSRDEFQELKLYLHPCEREEYLMLKSHLHTLTQYLSQVEPLKRFHAYQWLLDNFINLKGAFPTTQDLQLHVQNVRLNPMVDREVVTRLQQKTVLLAEPEEKPKLSLSVPTIKELPAPSTKTFTKEKPKRFNLSELESLPLQERARTVIKKLFESGFNIGGCIEGQTTVICGAQRGGKGTLLAILAILSKALSPKTKITYFTAGKDIYPFRCDRLVYAGSYPYAQKPDAMVAQQLYEHIGSMSKAEVGSLSEEILVIDEAIALGGYLTDEQNAEVAKFLLTRAEKTGCQTFIVLHAQNLTAWIGAKNTSGLASTFKSSVTFIGCQSTKVKVSELKTVSVATGEYFLADPNSFAKPLQNGELGVIPEWLKTETNPTTGMPDPARTLLSIFPELVSNNLHSVAEKEVLDSELEIVKEVQEVLPSSNERPSRENDFNFIMTVGREAKNYMLRQEWNNSDAFELEKLRKTNHFKTLAIANNIGLNKAEAEAVLSFLQATGDIQKLDGDKYKFVARSEEG